MGSLARIYHLEVKSRPKQALPLVQPSFAKRNLLRAELWGNVDKNVWFFDYAIIRRRII
jgi:hypothetical protein